MVMMSGRIRSAAAAFVPPTSAPDGKPFLKLHYYPADDYIPRAAHEVSAALAAYLTRLADDAETIERAGFETVDVAEAMSPELVALVAAIEAIA